MPLTSDTFEIVMWGPKKLRQIFKSIQDRVNAITPIAGVGIEIESTGKGMQISIPITPKGQEQEGAIGGSGGGGSGTPVNLYGAVNGQPGIFHLVQTSPPSPVP